MGKIRITIRNIALNAELFDTKSGQAIEDALPVDAGFEVWGDEFYFEVPVELALDESATTKVKAGDIGYWPPGNSLAIFFGPTPISSGPDPVPASDVNIVGRITGDTEVLKLVKGAKKIRVEKV